MIFNLIYGKSGSGKSEYLYKDLSNKIGTQSIYLIVPEQSNLTAEKKLFEYSGRNTLLNVEVLTLSRMASRVFDELEIPQKTRLSKTGKAMLIYDILSKEKSKLKFLGKSDKNIDIIGNMLTEFKKHGITINDLESFSSEDEYMNLKIKDISIIYKKYQDRLEENFIDENDTLDILAENLGKSKLFDNSIIYIDDFQGFTFQEFRVFEKLLLKASEVSATVCSNDLDGKSEKETDIFYFNKKFAKKMLEIAKTCDAEINKIYLADSKRLKNDELIFLEKNLYETNREKFDKNVKNIQLFLANNSYSEMEYVAKEITKLVHFQGFRYNEIGIVTKDIEGYEEDAKVVFEKYRIPLFIDSKKELNQNILIKYIISLLEIYSKNWSYDSVINYLKLGLNNFSIEEVYELENYCRKWGIKSSKWYNREFNYEPINDKQSRLEEIRKEFVQPLIKLKKNTLENRTFYEITKEICNFLEEREISQKLDKRIKEINNIELSEEYNTSYKILIQILDELVMLFKDEKVGFEKYKELLQIGIKNSELGKLPLLQDQVILGDTERSRSHKIRALFAVGINDGVFPAAAREEGYLNDRDREVLKENGMEIAKTGEELLYEEEFNIYRTLSLPEEKLYLSFDSSDKEGKSLRPSTLIKKIKRLYPNLIQNSDLENSELVIANEIVAFEEALRSYRKFLDGEKLSSEEERLIIYFYKLKNQEFNLALEGSNFSNLPDRISKENIQNLYGKTLKTSISRLEAFRKCPFSFHLTYGLGLKEKEELKMEAVDTGSFMHEVIDKFFKILSESDENVKEITEEKITQICNKIIQELLEESKYYTFSSTAKFRLLTRRLKKVVLKSIEYIVYTLKSSDFEVLDHEIEFNNLSEFKPIQMSLFDDNRLEIVGKIDRVDIGLVGGKQYVRVIDYKSSAKKMDLNQIASGLQIQLITYLGALTESKDYEASGLLYLGLIDNIVKSTKNMPEEDIEREIRKAFRMQGFVLADVKVVKAMDKNLESGGTSNIIPVTLTKDDEISNYKSNSLTKDEFKNLQKAVKKAIKNISEEILRGNIDIRPYNYDKKTGCDYCNYRTICNFSTNIKGNEYDYINKYSKEFVLEQIADDSEKE